MKSLSIRVRLTLWYGVVLAVTLLGCGFAVYLMARYGMLEGVDHGLHAKYDEIAEWLENGTDPDEITGPAGSHHQQYLMRVRTPGGVTLVESESLRGGAGLVPTRRCRPARRPTPRHR